MNNKFFIDDANLRGKPFWALNGKLNVKELKKQINTFFEMGFGGVFLHSRTGLETEYLSYEWLKLINTCTDELKKNGMEAWLYDEDRWPSGTCGGLVAKKKNNRLKLLECRCVDPEEYNKPARLVALFAADVHDNSVYYFKKVKSKDEVKKNQKLLVFFWEYMEPTPFYNGYTYIDTLNKSSVKDFLIYTHEKYKKSMGKKFGNQIKGIFQDEVSRGPIMNGFFTTNKNNKNQVPYTYKLFDFFKKKKKYDLKDFLPILFYKDQGENFSKTMYDYIEILMEMLLENFIIPYHEWCAKNDLLVTGHILHEDSLSCQTTMIGSAMRYYEYMDIPGIDNLGKQNYCYEVPRLASSVSKQLGKKYTLSEMYGCTGWNMKLDDYKHDGDWQSFMGINFRCPHLSWYTMKGEGKRDCPASIMSQSAWYMEYKKVEDYFAVVNYIFSSGKDMTENLIINPIESAWGLSHLGTYINFFGVNDSEYSNLEKSYKELFYNIQISGSDADYGDEGLIAKYGKVESGKFIIGQKSYKRVIISNLITIRKTTLDLLNKMNKTGGKVFFVSCFPRYLDGNRISNSIFNGYKLFPLDYDKITSDIRETEYNVDIFPKKSGIFVRRLKTLDGHIIALLNSSKDYSKKVKITISTKKGIIKLNAREKLKEYIPYIFENGKIVISYEFFAGEELFLMESEEKLLDKSLIDEKKIEICDDFFYELSEDNFIPLDRAVFLNGEEIDERQYILNKDYILRKKYNISLRNTESIQPWFKNKYFKNYFCKKYGKQIIKFEFIITRSNLSGIYLMVEDHDNFVFKINDNQMDSNNWENVSIDNCFSKKEIPIKYLKYGMNIVTMCFDFSDKINIEAIYLCGKFGVKAGEIDSIIDLPKKIFFGDINDKGFPFYTGKMTYLIPVDKGEYRVNIKEIGAAAVSVMDEILAFRPYNSHYNKVENNIKLTYIFGRQNLFGNHIGPYSSCKRELIPQGMIIKPDIYKKC